MNRGRRLIFDGPTVPFPAIDGLGFIEAENRYVWKKMRPDPLSRSYLSLFQDVKGQRIPHHEMSKSRSQSKRRLVARRRGLVGGRA